MDPIHSDRGAGNPITRLAGEARPLSDDDLADLYAVPAAPWLRVNFVTSLDGATEVDGSSTGLSSPPDQRLMGLLRMQCDALLLGAGTLRAEGYGPMVMDEWQREWRRRNGLADHPTLVVVSGSLRLDPLQPAFAQAPVRPIVLTQATAPDASRAALSAAAEVVTAGEGTVDLAAGVAMLHRRGLHRILSEGGPHVLGGLTAADLVDELCLTVSPLLAGPGAGRITAGPTGPLHRMSLGHVLAVNGMLMLRYRRDTNPTVGNLGT